MPQLVAKAKLVTRCLIWCKKFILHESFEESGILATQAKVCMQITGLATQPFNIKDQYECLVEHIEMMEGAKYTIKEAKQAMPEL